MTNISNDETVEPGTLVRGPKGQVVYEVLETAIRSEKYLMARLCNARTGLSVGWRYLDTMVRCDADGKEFKA